MLSVPDAYRRSMPTPEPEVAAGVEAVDLDGRTVLVTGSTSGIGRETALALARLGATVLVHGRDRTAGQTVVDAVREAGAGGSFYRADFADWDAVRGLAERIREDHDRLDALVNNAGGYFPGRGTAEGVDYTFAVNHFAPFLLTLELLPALRAAPEGRVVTVASEAHRGASLPLDDLEAGRSFSGWHGYARSKLANVLFTFELARRVDDATANCLHPGVIPGSGITRFLPRPLSSAAGLFGVLPGVDSVADGAVTPVYLVAAPAVAGTTGAYFENCRERRASAAARDRGVQRRLWDLSVELTAPTVRPGPD